MDSEIGNIEAAECERLLSGNVVQPHIYGSKEPVCVEFRLRFIVGFVIFICKQKTFSLNCFHIYNFVVFSEHSHTLEWEKKSWKKYEICFLPFLSKWMKSMKGGWLKCWFLIFFPLVRRSWMDQLKTGLSQFPYYISGSSNCYNGWQRSKKFKSQ